MLDLTNETFEDAALARYTESRQAHWDDFAQQSNKWQGLGGYYHQRLAEIYRFMVMPQQRVLEVGCGKGDLLAALSPAVGVGVDFSTEMIAQAARRHPSLQFVQADAHDLSALESYANTPFDVIILSDLLNDVWDVQTVLEQVTHWADSHTRIIINSYSRLWELPLAWAQKLDLAQPVLNQNWLTVEDIAGLLELAGWQTINTKPELLFPLSVPLIAPLANRVLVKLPFFRTFALTNFILARPSRLPQHRAADTRLGAPKVSVVVPARNEAGNIEQIFSRVPEMGGGTELIFVEGHSQDDTYAAIERALAAHPERICKLWRQTGAGKGDAVRLGFAEASGDILMILDADLTVPPEDLPRFYEALSTGKGEFINGVRLVYPMEDGAMRFANLLGNKFFSLAFSALLGQPVKDTLCGTKVLWRRDYERLTANRAYFGDFDPFGDFDLLFGAAKLNLKITEIPVRYRERTYGTTNIQRWRHGWLLLKMVLFAAGRIKFV
ncbi:MAG: glycosyltransferase [Acidobacteria bacterium]|nr:glycosyltransferase [Acidobacteriota bacterium]MBI3426358.1 glycosyltransferase [Acidobacteriota bacterium]